MKALLLATVSTLLLAEGPPEVIRLRTTLSAESIRLPQRETLGLVGLSSTADLGPVFLGPGLYGAVRGVRGGFFTFGLEGGLRGQPFPSLPLEWNGGLFVGAGGGGAAPQGGGLMLRPHAGAALVLGNVRLGADLSRVTFPNGGINSTQAALTLAFTSDHLWLPTGSWGTVFAGPVNWEARRLDFEVLRVESPGTVLRVNGINHEPMELGGLSLSRDLRGPWFRFLSVDGAMRGSSSGYAQALAGLGVRSPQTALFGLEARLGAGMAGGGGVDTGGGFIFSGEGAVTVGRAGWRASAGLGFIRAPAGQLDSRMVTIRVTHRTSIPVPSAEGGALQGVDFSDWRVGSGVLVYRRAPRSFRQDAEVQIMTLRADRELSPGFYLSGEAGSATGGGGGGTGGYSTGLVGLGCETSMWAQQRLFLEAGLGAGGGGGLRSGGGLLASLRTGWRLELPLGLGLDATVGKVRAPRGDLDSTTYGLGLHLRFKSMEK
jgi:hypothetical protein